MTEPGTEQEKTIFRLVEETLTEKQRRTVSDELADDLLARDMLDAERKASAKKFKDDLTVLAVRIERAGEKLRTGIHGVGYVCRLILNPKKKEREYVDTDSGKIVDTEPFREEDLQVDIFDTVKKEAAEEKEAKK